MEITVLVSTDYRVIRNRDCDSLEEQVTKLLNNGWQVQGNLVLGVVSGYAMFCQPMIKYNRKKVADGD